MADYYVKEHAGTRLVDDSDSTITTLLWGDPVFRADGEPDGSWIYVRARGRYGWVRKTDLRARSSHFNGLLEFHFIDVGQGDAVLCRTPDDRWHLIDAGVPNSCQMTRKGAANFLRWKFQDDLGLDGVQLHTLTASHPDYDHYGGMLDLLSGSLSDGRTFSVSVDHFYHCGMGRFADSRPLGTVSKGMVAALPIPNHGISQNDHFITQLLDGKDSFANPPRPFTTSFAQLAQLVGQTCGAAARLSRDSNFLPGYEPGANDVTVHVLGPIAESVGNRVGLRKLGSGGTWESKTRNGHSVVYRFDYGNARILLTGDLNEESQRVLLSYVPANEFAADVVKGCHHGSDDVNMDFIKAMAGRATVISSGDNESYAHPRPRVLGASAKYGREFVDTKGELQPPLLYSTELSRSVQLSYATRVKVDGKNHAASKAEVKTSTTNYEELSKMPIATDLIYGLVNVRTDGDTILCATMKESGTGFDMRLLRAGV